MKIFPEVQYTKEEMDKFLQLAAETEAMKKIISNAYYDHLINFVIGDPS